MLLWLWRRLAAVALIHRLAWEFRGSSPKKQKKKKKVLSLDTLGQSLIHYLGDLVHVHLREATLLI